MKTPPLKNEGVAVFWFVTESLGMLQLKAMCKLWFSGESVFHTNRPPPSLVAPERGDVTK